jgi:Repeat of unknown function (DUF5648)
VLGHSIPPPERISLAEKMKRIRPNVPIVMVCRQGDNAFSKEFADVIAGRDTLEGGYEKLTGQSAAFGPFSRLLGRFFPGTQNNIANDNPFPLMFTDHFYTTSVVEHDATIHPAVIKFYRMYSPSSGDHFYTASADERDNAFVVDGYRFEGTSFFIFPQPMAGTVPLYRLANYNSGDHFYTTSEAERQNAIFNDGYLSEGIAGYVFAAQQPDTTPVYRLLNPRTSDHFYTTSAAERDTGSIPLFRAFNPRSGDHFYTSSAAERDHAVNNLGYNDEGTAANVLATPGLGTTPLLRLFSAAPA